MSIMLFPKRQRCKTCGKKLDTVVLDGLYCSYKCASLPTPTTRIEDAPRACKTQRDGRWTWKRKYRCLEEVPQHILDLPSTNMYRCEHCHFLHVGHDRMKEQEVARLVRDPKTLGSTLLRIREEANLTRKQVADKIKTRPIRVKEIEEANATINTKVLFDLMYYYHLKLNVVFPTA